MEDRSLRATDAAAGSIRRLWATETPAFRAHLARLDRNGLRMRFAGAVSPAHAENYANDALKRARVVYGWFEDGMLRGASELHGARFSQTGEVAFSVEPDYQGRGIGTALMGRVVLAARNRGMRHLVVSCLSENSPMQRIARRHEADIAFHQGEVVGTLHPQTFTGLSFLREAISESHGIVRAMIDVQAGMIGHSG